MFADGNYVDTLHTLTHLIKDSNATDQPHATIASNEEIHKAAPMHLPPVGGDQMEAVEILAPQMRCRTELIDWRV